MRYHTAVLLLTLCTLVQPAHACRIDTAATVTDIGTYGPGHLLPQLPLYPSPKIGDHNVADVEM